MSRPLTGSVRQRNGKWSATVPTSKGSRRRRQERFASEYEARSWLRQAVSAIEANRAILRLSGRTILVHVHNSRHHILLESPDDVVSAVRAMIESASPVAQQRQDGARGSMVRPHSDHREFGR